MPYVEAEVLKSRLVFMKANLFQETMTAAVMSCADLEGGQRCHRQENNSWNSSEVKLLTWCAKWVSVLKMNARPESEMINNILWLTEESAHSSITAGGVMGPSKKRTAGSNPVFISTCLNPDHMLWPVQYHADSVSRMVTEISSLLCSVLKCTASLFWNKVLTFVVFFKVSLYKPVLFEFVE